MNYLSFLQDFSPIIRLMLTHPSFIDGATCLFSTILILQPLNWVPGVKILDELICHLWNGQYVYWYAVLMSGKYISVKLVLSLVAINVGPKVMYIAVLKTAQVKFFLCLKG